jgi:hypothetical protein
MRCFSRHGLILALSILPCVPSAAQSFEAVYGAPGANEYGFRGVTPVTVCPGGGYVAAGTRGAGWLQLWCGPAAAASDVYVVRTAANGAVLWETTYDIGGAGGSDLGAGIVDLGDGQGFAVTGTTDNGSGNDDVFLMGLDCNGGVRWTKVFDSVDQGHEYGLDVIEARSSGGPPNPYDLVVAGITQATAQRACLTPGTGGNGLLLRTDAAGTLLWSQAYDTGVEEGFAAVAQTWPTQAQPLGGLVAAGRRAQPGGTLGWAVQTLANGTALFGADYGVGAPATEFLSIEQLGVPPLANQFVLVGNALTPTAAGLYLARAWPNVCVRVRDALVPGAAGFDVLETRTLQGLTAPGDLVVAGHAARDALLLTASAATLVPNAGGTQLFGDHGAWFDGAASLAEVPGAGFVMAGVSSSDFEVICDPQDLYLVKTDTWGRTNGCEAPWNRAWWSRTWRSSASSPRSSRCWSTDRVHAGGLRPHRLRARPVRGALIRVARGSCGPSRARRPWR